jgi:hypothetical protein
MEQFTLIASIVTAVIGILAVSLIQLLPLRKKSQEQTGLQGTPSSWRNWGDHPTTVVLTTLAGVLGIIVAIAINITSSGITVESPTPTSPASTAIPIDTAVIVTVVVTRVVPSIEAPSSTTVAPITPILTPTIGDTFEDVVLQVGDTWRSEGVELTLREARREANGILVTNWQYVNNTSNLLTVSYSAENFTARDSTGRQLDVLGFSGPESCSRIDMIVRPGESIANAGCEQSGLIIEVGSFVDARSIVITASNISRIQQARWLVALPE